MALFDLLSAEPMSGGAPAEPLATSGNSIDPTSRDLLIRTVIGEAAGEPDEGQAGVAHVALNRLNSGRYGKSMEDVLFAPKQFEPWNTRKDELLSISPDSSKYQRAAQIVDGVLGGQIGDPTKGALNFANVDTVRARGNNAGMSWINDMVDNGSSIQIGRHTFGTPGSRPGGSGSSRTAAAPQSYDDQMAARGATPLSSDSFTPMRMPNVQNADVTQAEPQGDFGALFSPERTIPGKAPLSNLPTMPGAIDPGYIYQDGPKPNPSQPDPRVASARPLNPTVTAAAERGRGPAADRPARGIAMSEGPAAVRQAPPDLSNSNDGGARDFILRQAGMAPDQQQASPGGFIVPGGTQVVGGLGGLGGVASLPASRVVAPPAGNDASPAPARSVDSMIPAAASDPFALIGPGAAKNQEWAQQREGRVAFANELVRLGMDPQRAVGLTATPEGVKLALAQINQEKVSAAGREAAASLLGIPNAPAAPAAAPASPGASASAPTAPSAYGPKVLPSPSYNPVTDQSLEGLNRTDKARMVAPLRVLLNPHAPKEMKDLAEAQYKSILDETKATPTTREYLIAKGQGFTGTLMEYKERLAKAGATNIDQRAENSEAKGRGEGLSKRWNDIADDGTKAGEDSVLFQRFGDLLDTVKTGNQTATLEKIRQITNGGLTLDKNTNNVQALVAMINYIAPRLRVPGSGAQSDKELSNFLSSIPSLAGTPGGNKLILDTLSGSIKYRRDRAAIATEWQQGDISAKEAQQRVDALPSPYAIKPAAPPPAEKTVKPPPPPQSGGTPAQSAPGRPKTATNPTTGERIMQQPDGSWAPFDG